MRQSSELQADIRTLKAFEGSSRAGDKLTRVGLTVLPQGTLATNVDNAATNIDNRFRYLDSLTMSAMLDGRDIF
jgi:hypothetical protein